MVSITPAPLQSVDLPTREQQDALLKMVAAAHPQLRLPEGGDPYSHRHMFARAMLYAAHARRQPEPATGYATSFWAADCRDFLERYGETTGGVVLLPFVSALIASGVTYTSPTNWPWLSFGLAVGASNQPSSMWRTVLERGIPPPTEPRVRPAVREIPLDMIRPHR
jgi:hypothetical protein